MTTSDILEKTTKLLSEITKKLDSIPNENKLEYHEKTDSYIATIRFFLCEIKEPTEQNIKRAEQELIAFEKFAFDAYKIY